jgi:hypothetical protein
MELVIVEISSDISFSNISHLIVDLFFLVPADAIFARHQHPPPAPPRLQVACTHEKYPTIINFFPSVKLHLIPYCSIFGRAIVTTTPMAPRDDTVTHRNVVAPRDTADDAGMVTASSWLFVVARAGPPKHSTAMSGFAVQVAAVIVEVCAVATGFAVSCILTG